MATVKKTKQAEETVQAIVIANSPVEGLKSQEDKEISSKELLETLLSNAPKDGLTTSQMRERIFLLNKLRQSDTLSLIKEEWLYVLNLLQTSKFPQIITGVLKLEESIATALQPEKKEVKES